MHPTSGEKELTKLCLLHDSVDSQDKSWDWHSMLQKGAWDGKCYVTTEAHGLWSVHAAASLGPDAPVIFLPLLKASLITSPGRIHETSAQGWCTGKNQTDGMGWEVGGGIGMGNTCKSMADSCPCMAKTTTIL